MISTYKDLLMQTESEHSSGSCWTC